MECYNMIMPYDLSKLLWVFRQKETWLSLVQRDMPMFLLLGGKQTILNLGMKIKIKIENFSTNGMVRV